MISSLVNEVLSIAEAYMSLGTSCSAEGSVALAAGLSLVFILQAGDLARVSIQARQFLSTYVTTTDCNPDSVKYAVFGLNE